MRSILLIVCLTLSTAVFAAGRTLIDLQSAIIQEDYKTASVLAAELLTQGLPRAQAQEVRYYQGLSSLRLGEYPLAHETFKKLIEDKPAVDLSDKASVGLIDSLYMQGLYENALKEATGLIKKRKDSELMSLILLKAARSNLKLARWIKAREYLQRITESFPGSFESPIARQLLEEKQFFTVQIGAYKSKDSAEKLVKDLIKRGEYAYVVETKSADGQLMCRVRVGQLAALKDAQELEIKLSGLGYSTLIYP